jgi:hypothetical protein
MLKNLNISKSWKKWDLGSLHFLKCLSIFRNNYEKFNGPLNDPLIYEQRFSRMLSFRQKKCS